MLLFEINLRIIYQVTHKTEIFTDLILSIKINQKISIFKVFSHPI